MPIHRKLAGEQIHVPHTWEYADKTARVAATGFLSTDEKKLAFQLDDFSYWVLSDFSVPSWTALGSLASDTAYNATSWNGNTDAPTKNAVRDKIELMSLSSGASIDDAAGDGDTSVAYSADKIFDLNAAQNDAIALNTAKETNVDHPLVDTAVPVGAVFTDTVYDDTAIQAAVNLNTAKVSNVDHPLVEAAVPVGALFTDTIYDDTTIQSEVDLNTAKVSNIDHPLIETAVPIGAIFTDTVYDDTAIQAAVDLNTEKVTNVDHPLVETAVPVGAVFTDTNTVYDDTAIQAAVDLNTAKVSNVDHPADSLIAQDITDIGNLSGINTGDQDLTNLQTALVSGTSIKTINSISLLGSGDIVISGAGADDTPYNATSWNDNTDAPTKNAVRDKIELMSLSSGASIDDAAGDGDTSVAYSADKIFDLNAAQNDAIALNTDKATNATHTGEVSGATVLTIADNIIDEANLKLDEAPTNGHVLTADSSKSGGMKWVGTSVDPIETPSITFPTNEATDATLSMVITGTQFRSLYGYAQTDAQIQVSELSDFVSTTVDTVTGTAVSSFDITGLDITTLYYCRIRYQDSDARWSDWSEPIQFTTANTYIDTPVNVGPANLETAIGETPTLSSDAFECINGSDTHLSSDWEIYSDVSLSTLVWSNYDDTTNKTTADVPAGNLSASTTNYYWRCRHTGTTYGNGAWSTATKFTTKDMFALIYGIAMVSSGGWSGTWQLINELGNDATLTVTDFNNHPVWGGIETVTIDGQSMVKIPKFYIKVGTLASGDQVGKKAWLVSDSPATGYALHPAFMDGGVEIDQFWYGAYEATNDGGTKAGSVVGVAPLVSIDFPTMQNRCNARNTGGVDGFSMVNIHQLSAVQTLLMIENGGPDVQSTIGIGNTASSAAVNTGSSNAVWRGIYELWGNVFCGVDGVQWDTNNQVKIYDQNGNGTYVSTGVTASATDGWTTGMHDDTGTGYDLGTSFLGTSFDATESNGSFGDYQYPPNLTEDNVCYHGGYWDSGSLAGLFFLLLGREASDLYTLRGSRLAKV